MARPTRAGVVSEAGRTPEDVDEVVRGLNAGRTRPAKLLTMLPEDWERLDEIASRWGCKRSQAVARLVRAAALPPRPRPPK